MKRTGFIFLFIMIAFQAAAQRLPSVGIMPFRVTGSGVSAAEAAEATRMVIAEMSSWGLINVLSGGEAAGADYLVEGQVSRQNNRIVLGASTSQTSSKRILNNSREEAASLNAISYESFCAKIAENIPFPNYLLGKWRSTIDMSDGPITCIMEFLSDRTIRVEQYDTWEHNGTDSLKYQAIGKGTYTYAGYLRRNVNVGGGRSVQSDATVGINLALEDALPKYVTIEVGGLRVLFNEAKSSFEFAFGALPCGDNFTGPSIYPNKEVYYVRFNKIQ